MLWHNAVYQRIGERAKQVRQREGHRPAINRLNDNSLPTSPEWRLGIGILDNGIGKSHVISCKRLTVLPGKLGFELNGVGGAALVLADTLRQIANQIIMLVVGKESR